MDLYADPITVNCKKVVSGLQMMGVPYQLKRVDYFKGEHKQSPMWTSTRTPPCRR
jgi:glutathione S-transferase